MYTNKHILVLGEISGSHGGECEDDSSGILRRVVCSQRLSC
jgi:hypothetical protein